MLLSLDRSLPAVSMALFEKGACLAAATAPATAAQQRPWETLLDDLLQSTGTKLETIDELVVGLGPGSFSGIRTALAFAKGLSLPAGTPLRGFPSAAAMAREFFRNTPEATRAFVVGDARRDTVWLADYRRDSVWAEDAMCTGPRVDIACLTLAEAQSVLTLSDAPFGAARSTPPGGFAATPLSEGGNPRVTPPSERGDAPKGQGGVLRAAESSPGKATPPAISPDFQRLTGKLDGIRPCPAPGDRPLAQALGELALLAPGQGIVPPLPIYLHPAVRVVR